MNCGCGGNRSEEGETRYIVCSTSSISTFSAPIRKSGGKTKKAEIGELSMRLTRQEREEDVFSKWG